MFQTASTYLSCIYIQTSIASLPFVGYERVYVQVLCEWGNELVDNLVE